VVNGGNIDDRSNKALVETNKCISITMENKSFRS